ncbi:MAG: PHP domain-containing protein [Candidatus Woesearchaeota archaeon]
MALKKYDLHIHSHYSPCSIITPKEILRRAKKAGLDGIAITDHETMRAYPVLKKLNKDKYFEVIPGEEMRTQYGDVIGLYLKKEIKSRDFFTVIREIKHQGGLIIIPHPITYVRFMSMQYPFNKLRSIVDAIETINSRNTCKLNSAARHAAEKYGFAQTGGSDAHIPQDIGRGYTVFTGSLRDALRKRKTETKGSTRYAFISLGISIFVEYFIDPITKHWRK